MTIAAPLHDQTMAAFEEAVRAVKAIPSVGVAKTPITIRVVGKWARGLPEGVDFEYGLVKHWDQHEWTSCRHVNTTPQLCFGLAHMPGHLMCASCWLTAAAKSVDACDWCGMSAERDLYPAVYPIGPAIVLMLLCHEHVTSPDPQHWRKHLRNTLLSHT